MGLGGGTFSAQNKVLPGSYVNFVSSTGASEVLGDRGVAALPLSLDWGKDGEVFSLLASDFSKQALALFGYDYNSDELKGIRDLFLNAEKVYFFRMINGGVKASNTYADAKYKGVRGNDITIVISENVDDSEKFDVATLVDGVQKDNQIGVAASTDLVANDWVEWKTTALAVTVGLPLTGGSNGDALTGTEYQAALDAFEAVSFNALGCLATDNTIKDVFVAFTRRLRDENGIKFQTILHKREAADYEGVISIENNVTDSGEPVSSLVYWVLGAVAGAPVNESITNKLYTGEFSVSVNYTQEELETAIDAGKMMFHNVSDTVRVLVDVNTLTTFSEEKTSDFSKNQTIRVIDQVANDIAAIFNTKYLGVAPNDASSRVGLWNEIVNNHKELEQIGAIQSFSSDDITVAQGEDKRSVVITDYITPTNAMEQLYMTVVVQ